MVRASIGSFLSVSLLSVAASAQSTLALPAESGALAARVAVDLDAGVVRAKACAAEPCELDASAASAEVPFSPAERPSASAVSIAPVAIGAGRHALHVKVPSRDGSRMFEAIVVGRADAPIAFAGTTGWNPGLAGERTGATVRLDAASGLLIVADQREDTRICGQEATPLAPRALDPGTLVLRYATVPRLADDALASALPVVATRRDDAKAPLARLLSSPSASTELQPARAAIDGDPATSWREARPRAGRSEFLSLLAPSDVPLASLSVSFAGDGAAPRTFYVTTPARTFAVTMPEDARMHPGARYVVPFVEPVAASCVSLVLADAYTPRGVAEDVGFAEVEARSVLEATAPTLTEVAKRLASPPAEALVAAAILKRAGEPAGAVVAEAFPTLPASGRALAMDVAAALPCGSASPIVVGGLGDADREVVRKATGKLERCGKAAAAALLAALAGPDAAQRARVAPILALVAPAAAVDPLVSHLAEGNDEQRAELRRALLHASRAVAADRLASVLESVRPEARVDALRALGPRLHEIAPVASRLAVAVARASADWRERMVVIGPLGDLARDGDGPALATLADLASGDPTPAVRVRALGALGDAPQTAPSRIRALGDPNPRVREAAAHSLQNARVPTASAALSGLVSTEPWTFARVAAISALASQAPDEAGIDALMKAAKASSASVREASIDALARWRVPALANVARARLEDPDESAAVRIAAARAAGVLCDVGALDTLTTIARVASSPVSDPDEMALAQAALESLAAIHPSDLASRVATLADPAVRAEVRRAAAAALAAKGSCAR